MSEKEVFQRFKENFTPDQSISNQALKPKYKVAGFLEFFEKYSGKTFAGGAYHVLPYDKIEARTQSLTDAFPAFKKRAIPFSHDWLGRIFALDGARRDGDEPLVLWFDYANNDVLEIPSTFVQFHNEELVNAREVLLSTELYTQYLESGGKRPSPGQCSGFEVPMFLGGEESVANLKLIDADVYWHIMGQLIAKT